MTTQTGLRPEEGSRLADAASNVAEKAGQTVEAQASTAMDQIAMTVEQVAQAVRRAGDELRQEQPQIASIADTAATQVDHLANYLEGHEPREILDSLEEAARRQPAVVIGAGIAIGLVLGRLLRTTMPMNSSGSSRYRGGSSYATSSGYGYAGSGTSQANGGSRFSDIGDTGSSVVASTRAVPTGGAVDTGSSSTSRSTSASSGATGSSGAMGSSGASTSSATPRSSRSTDGSNG
jgi:ElaB/YqjD/DUF883 family membrane-anchored ribosome-binding protein